jgi:hypothetical protein
MNIAPNQDELLVSAAILGETDSIFYPLLCRFDQEWAPVYTARWAYPKRGIPWASKAVSEAGRKKTQLTIEALAARGDVSVMRDRAKIVRLKLSDAADAATRAALGLSSMLLCREVMSRLAALSTRPAKYLPDSWVSVFAIEPKREDALIMIRVLMPALVRRWVASMSTGGDCIYFALTDAGWEVLDSDLPPEEKVATSDENLQALRFYERRLSDAKSRRSKLEVSDGEIGPCPLPVSMGGQPIGGWRPEEC